MHSMFPNIFSKFTALASYRQRKTNSQYPFLIMQSMAKLFWKLSHISRSNKQNQFFIESGSSTGDGNVHKGTKKCWRKDLQYANSNLSMALLGKNQNFFTESSWDLKIGMQSTYTIGKLHTNFQIWATLSKKVLIFSQKGHGQIRVGIL